MSKRTRALIALGVGFVGYRIGVEFMQPVSALLVGLVLAGCTYALTARRTPPADGG